MRRLFLFRPEPGASRSAERAGAMGLEVVCTPLFAIEPVEWTAPDPAKFDALLITSANAPRAAGPQLDALRELPAHCVGGASALAAEVAGLGVASVGHGGVDELLAGIGTGQRLLHLAGEDRRLPERPAQSIEAIVVYRARALPRPQRLDELAGQVGALHSPRAAARLAELVDEQQRAVIRLAAISAAAASAAGEGWEAVEAASEPNERALLALAARLCER